MGKSPAGKGIQETAGQIMAKMTDVKTKKATAKKVTAKAKKNNGLFSS
jgi:hypothetical protein